MAQVGNSSFVATEHLLDGETAGEPCLWGSALGFGPDGDVGRRFDPPITSIPEFLARMDEVLCAM